MTALNKLNATAAVAPSKTSKAATPEQVARTFYSAFIKADFKTLESLYAPDVKFKDLVFEYSDRKGTMEMWKRIAAPQPGKTFSYKFDHVEGNVAVVKWTADYNFLGHPIHNELESRLTIKDGKIVAHEDRGDWHRWAHQAFPALDGFVDRPGGKKLIQHVLRSVLPLLPK